MWPSRKAIITVQSAGVLGEKGAMPRSVAMHALCGAYAACSAPSCASTDTWEDNWWEHPYLKDVGQSIGDSQPSEWLPLSMPTAAIVVIPASMPAPPKGHHWLQPASCLTCRDTNTGGMVS